jgi:hypothetical protein
LFCFKNERLINEKDKKSTMLKVDNFFFFFSSNKKNFLKK